jgi:hypothetical protein
MASRIKFTDSITLVSLLIMIAGLISMPSFALAQAGSTAGRVDTSSAGLISRVAPGEVLPISVKLVNFGNANRVDVIITYEITDLAGKSIFRTAETVAVQSTATFVKTIQIPFETTPGQYIAKSSLVYQDQVTPATTQFSFTVERKIFGLFQSDFYLYGIIVLIIAAAAGAIGYFWIKKRRSVRSALQEYPDVPDKDRIYYEILSDTIMQMRQRVGDDALTIASNIEGLKIDNSNGRVLAITEHPSKIIATLVVEYDHLLGKKVSFLFRRKKGN